MKRSTPFLLLSMLLLPAPIRSSDPLGIYAVIDRVVLEPPGGPPERVQLWGAFSLAGEGQVGTGTYPSERGGFYREAERGYLYYEAREDVAEIARIEWEDMLKLAGTGQCIAFGDRWQPTGRVRPGCESPEAPDPYPLNTGLVKVRPDTENPPARALLSMPTPLAPPDGGAVEAGEVTLGVRNALHPSRAGAGYLFRIEGEGRVLEVSALLPGGEGGETRWSPALRLVAGQRYRWSALAVEAGWEGPPAVACLEVPFLRGDANGDRAVDISDAVAILEYLFSGGRAPRPLEAGDANGNGELDLSDAIYLLNFLFLGGPEPPFPFPGSGLLPQAP